MRPTVRRPRRSAALPGGSQFTATAFSGATSCGPPAWRAAIWTAVERRMGSRRTAVERRPYRTIRNVPLRGATGSSQTESMEM